MLEYLTHCLPTRNACCWWRSHAWLGLVAFAHTIASENDAHTTSKIAMYHDILD